ncbi:MAG: hypothetical protein OEW64_05310 [Gammaproteobacteria bacterium]|nr:hypothetical protein [Gammaproteobacteria bacterium]MDH5303497.1 hypothetical protein [Gammaproteobacteria bacterium]MDH5321526.1 hypothetical protein [Gammaproteobacteria bacterium]
MIAANDGCCVIHLLLFIKTLFDIALLRKGPQHIPRSRILLLVAALFWTTAVLSALVLIDRFDELDVAHEFFSLLVAVTCYSAIVLGARLGPRLTQTITAILGCGALLTFTLVAGYVLLQPIIGAAPMTLVAFLILLWSLSIKGHIIAAAINQHWYLGLAIAVAIFVLQSLVNKLLTTAS